MKQLKKHAQQFFLGILIDDKLNWKDHTELNLVRNKISSGLYAINSSKHILSLEHLKSLYYTLVHPHITYAHIWYNAMGLHI